MWIWTCRPGFEGDLAEELTSLRHRVEARYRAPSLLASSGPALQSWPVFARTGFPLHAETAAEPEAVADALAVALRAKRGDEPQPWLLQSWVPDADETNPLSAAALALGERVAHVLATSHPALAELRVAAESEELRYSGRLAQLCLVAEERVLVGVLAAQEAPSLAPGGRVRARMPRSSPSRAARKLVEAFAWLRRGPEPGEHVVDLGAAPGGWTSVLLERRARVTAVDPANLAPALRARKGVEHVRRSAFAFAPEEPVDWLCCDMAWRPLEVAALLAKWGKRRWATALVANIKLPMRQRFTFVRRVREIVAGGWRDVRARQLYHDRDEFTLAGWQF